MASSSKDPLVIREKIMAALNGGQPRKALNLGQRMIKLPLASVQDCMAVAEMAERSADAQTAVAAVRAAAKRAPKDLALLFELMRVEFQSGYTKDAIKTLQVAASLCRTAEEFDTLGNSYNRLEEAVLAHEAFLKAHDLDPDHLHIATNLALSYGYIGQADKAEEIYDRSIAAGDTSGATFLNRSWLRKQTTDNNHIPELEKAIAEFGEGANEAPLMYYALSKEHEDVGNADEAFDALIKASAARRPQVEFSSAVEIEEKDDIIKTYNAEVMARKVEGCPSNEPIFIVGMPRSGSTLVERIITSHSQVYSAGELKNLGRAVRIKTMEAGRAAGQDLVDPLAMSLKIDFKSLGNSYIASTRPRTGHVPRFTDKQPSNFIYCGLIEQALPNAKIVHTARSAMDACYAILKQPFMQGYYFSYDQEELGTAYLSYLKLMAHWEEVMPGKIIHVKYEEMVADNETISRDLIKRLDLEWEDACLDFTSNEQASMTASANQVRQPIYSTSVEKWRQYENRLTVLRKTLEAGGVDVG